MNALATALDSQWVRAHPLPQPDDGADKNDRGRVLAIGGSRSVPGGIRLTAEAALRAGAGKVRVGTVESAAIALGVAMPEIGVLGLPEDAGGEIADGGGPAMASLLPHNDAIVVGPAIAGRDAAGRLVDRLLSEAPNAPIVLDAAALTCLFPDRLDRLRRHRSPVLLTPHVGEMAGLLGCELSAVERDRPGATLEAAERTGAVCVLKSATSFIADRAGHLYTYEGGSVGLATGGSGDVLAGIASGLLARGTDPLQAMLWAVWLHGGAGRNCARDIGEVGFLARELLSHIPGLMSKI
ncbi:NAD(P)H-hydrate dehydratase [Tsuneonella sp. HG094]